MTPRWRPPADAPCALAPDVDFFVERDAPNYDAGKAAIAICAGCPHRTICAQTAVAHNERYGIWGATSTARRRALRRHFGTPRWQQALEAHFRRVDGDDPLPGDDELLLIAGPGMAHGHRGRFAKGCRCDDCAAAASIEGALSASGLPRSLTTALTAWTTGGTRP